MLKWGGRQTAPLELLARLLVPGSGCEGMWGMGQPVHYSGDESRQQFCTVKVRREICHLDLPHVTRFPLPPCSLEPAQEGGGAVALQAILGIFFFLLKSGFLTLWLKRLITLFFLQWLILTQLGTTVVTWAWVEFLGG